MGDKPKVGDEVLYTVHERTEVVAIDGITHVTIKMRAGPQKGEQFLVPWDKINNG